MPPHSNDEPEFAESTFKRMRSFVDRVIGEMSFFTVASFVFVGFFFCYGATVNLIRFFGERIKDTALSLGPVVGGVGALLLLVYILYTKRRLRSERPKVR